MEKKNIKVLLSTGLGRLHFIDAVRALSERGVQIEVLQGWIPPSYIPKKMIDIVGKLIGFRNLSFGLMKRKMEFLEKHNVHSNPLPEFMAQLLFIFSKFKIVNKNYATRISWIYFGKLTHKYIGKQLVFHVRSGAGGGGAIKEAKKRGLKVIVDHSIAHPAYIDRILSPEYINHGMRPLISADDIFWKLVLDDCKDADILLVNSSFVRDTFINEGFNPVKIKVAYLGVRQDFIGIKEDYEIKDCLNLLFTGGFGLRKGAPHLIKALEILNNNGVDFRLTIMGDISEAENLINNSSIKHLINSPGHVPQDELKKYLKASDIYIFPTLAEGCAQSGMEAMAAGLPIITTKESGLPIEQGVDGILITAKSENEICSAIEVLRKDKLQRSKIGTSASIKIKNNYTWDNYAETVYDIYEKLIVS